MTTTDIQREIAAAIAADRQHRHDAAGHRDNRVDLLAARGGQHYKGLLGEFALCDLFGGAPDLSYRPKGDEHDAVAILKGSGKPVFIDVKTSSYWGEDPYLMVARHKLQSHVVYVAARYHGGRDDVDLAGWITGKELLARNEVRTFTTVPSFIYPYEQMHPLAALKLIVA
jgi:hypothetical protein